MPTQRTLQVYSLYSTRCYPRVRTCTRVHTRQWNPIFHYSPIYACNILTQHQVSGKSGTKVLYIRIYI